MRHTSVPLYFYTDPAPSAIYTLSLHDALPISTASSSPVMLGVSPASVATATSRSPGMSTTTQSSEHSTPHNPPRSEEHTSELQSHSDLVCRLLLEKKNHILEYPRVYCIRSV